MMDIVERLRKSSDWEWVMEDICSEAADELERLREQERKMTNHALERMEEIERLREALREAWAYVPEHHGPVQHKIKTALQQKESE